MKSFLLFTLSIFIVLPVGAQEEFTVVNDFETDPGDWRRDAEGAYTGWVTNSELTTAGEPHHGGESALKVDVSKTGGWVNSFYQFPVPFDATEMDEFRMWVYSEDEFYMRAEIGPGLIMGYDYYGWDDLGTWKEFVFWISEEQARHWESQLTAADEVRIHINPSEETVDGVLYPASFDGTIYIDDMSTRKRVPAAREYLTLIGFNDYSDEYYISLAGGGIYFEVLIGEGPTPTEGEGILTFDYTSSWSMNIEIDLKDFPEILEYDRIHMDIFVDGTSWATTAMILRTSQWVDENGDPHGTSWTQISDANLGTGVGGDWVEISGHYGPLNSEGNKITDDDGTILDSLIPELIGIYDDPNTSISLTVTSQGSAANDGVFAYLDNIRLSRPSETSVSNWELW